MTFFREGWILVVHLQQKFEAIYNFESCMNFDTSYLKTLNVLTEGQLTGISNK